MQQEFQHKHGMILMDEEAIYFCQNNNWEEAKRLSEKEAEKVSGRTASKFARTLAKLILVFSIGFVVMALYRNSENIKPASAIILGMMYVVAIIIFLYQRRFKHKCMIPLSKISEVEKTKNDQLVIHFTNALEKSDLLHVKMNPDTIETFTASIKK